jgi:hypothetical protein
MPLYKPQSLNESGSQVPNFTPRYSYAECPTEEKIMKRCSHVNVNSVGTYAFLYETTASYGGTTNVETYMTGSKVNHANAGGIKVEVNPIAWRRTDAAESEGDVTFVYVRTR